MRTPQIFHSVRVHFQFTASASASDLTASAQKPTASEDQKYLKIPSACMLAKFFSTFGTEKLFFSLHMLEKLYLNTNFDKY